VVRKPGGTVTEEQVKAFAAERLAKYKRPEGGVEFVERLPKSPIGKILKKFLRERAERETRHEMFNLELICKDRGLPAEVCLQMASLREDWYLEMWYGQPHVAGDKGRGGALSTFLEEGSVLIVFVTPW
jgi:hypothetical protein